MREATKKRIMHLHNKGLSVYYIQKELKVKSWIAQEVIGEHTKEDFDSLFRGG